MQINCSPKLPQVFDGATKILSALQFWTASFDPKVMRVKVASQEKYADKLEAAKAYLGTRWVLHPEYTAHPAHREKDAYLTKPEPEPHFIEINGHKVPEPMSEVPEKGARYYVFDLHQEDMIYEYRWADNASDSRWFERGLIHATREAAYAHAKALLSFTEVNHKEN